MTSFHPVPHLGTPGPIPDDGGPSEPELSAAQEFLDLWRSGNRQLAVLARIGLRNRSTLAATQVLAATDQVTTPAGSVEPCSSGPPRS
jgi:hypothetical protein